MRSRPELPWPPLLSGSVLLQHLDDEKATLLTLAAEHINEKEGAAP